MNFNQFFKRVENCFDILAILKSDLWQVLAKKIYFERDQEKYFVLIF